MYSKVPKLADAKGVNEKHPAYGLRRNLIRLIGNLAYRHKDNQDKVRESTPVYTVKVCFGKSFEKKIISIFDGMHTFHEKNNRTELLRNHP